MYTWLINCLKHNIAAAINPKLKKMSFYLYFIVIIVAIYHNQICYGENEK